MRKLEQTPLIYLALAATLASALTAQATGRTITTIAPANIGSTAQFAASYPTSAAGNLGWYVMAGHQVGTVPVPIPGFTVNGSCRVNPAVLFQTFLFFMDGTGISSLSLVVPNSISLFGLPFDLQTLDANLLTSELSWSDNDAEVLVGPGGQGPLASANMVVIPAGSFAMGSTTLAANEQPVHQVTISRPFWMSKYEVTQAEYQAIIGSNPSAFPGANRPVEMVNWIQAFAYCAVLTATERAAGRLPAGYEYRLPTEAEWEYCCRAGTTTEWNTGTSITTADANYYRQTFGQTVPVGSYAANAFGLFDMHGNVWEWCLDYWDGSNNYPSSAVNDPYVRTGAYHVLRGGDWNSTNSLSCRSAYRRMIPTYATNGYGFRVVLAPSLGPAVVPPANFLAIPAGDFRMGSTAGQATEQPVHLVTISQPFWMGKYEVTQAEYQAVLGNNPSYFLGASRPVEQVSWNDAITYCAFLTAAERRAGRLAAGYEYRLPTEAEWEYCCRAGRTTEWNTGTSISTAQANISGGVGVGQTTNVGAYAANIFGLFDMHGNVEEFCLDAWDGSSNYPSYWVTDPLGVIGPLRVLRGGGWDHDSSVCRSAFRLPSIGQAQFNNRGFRVACAPVMYHP